MLTPLLACLLMLPCSGFLITEAEPGLLTAAPDQRVNLRCTTDGHYEWCKFISPTGQFCDFEWKRHLANVTTLDCQLDRVEFHGSYNKKQCGVSFLATAADAGTWKCEVEQYKLGRSRGAGAVVTADMLINIQTSTTEATTTTTTTTTTTSAAPIISTAKTNTTKAVKIVTTTTKTTSTTTTKAPAVVVTTEASSNRTEAPEAVPRVEEKASGNSATSIVLALLAVALVAAAVGAALYWRKRRANSSGQAAVVYDQAARAAGDTAGMVRGSQGNVSIQSGRESANLHEYFPPNLNYAANGESFA